VPTLQEISGKAGEEIPLFGRNVAHEDNFDTLTSARSYKQAWS
jgi:HD-GYP domain-containing protein (c-di-GMP phosphodiesterase class II)